MTKEEKVKRFVSEDEVPLHIRMMIQNQEHQNDFEESIKNKSPRERFYGLFINYKYGLNGYSSDVVKADENLNRYLDECVFEGSKKEDAAFNLFCGFINGTNQLRKNNKDAVYMVKYLKESNSLNIQDKILKFLTNLRGFNVTEELHYCYYRHYEIYNEMLKRNVGNKKEILTLAIKFIKQCIEKNNNLSARDELRSLYKYNYIKNPNVGIDDFCYMSAINEKIPEAEYDYAVYLQNNNNKMKAAFWYVKSGSYNEAYQCVNIFNKDNIESVIEYMNDEISDTHAYAVVNNSLKNIQANYSTICNLEKISSYNCTSKNNKKFRTLILLYFLFGPLWGLIRGYQKNIIMFILGIIGCVISGYIENIIPLAVYTVVMLIWDVYDRKKYIKVCQLITSLHKHPQIDAIKELPAYVNAEKISKDNISILLTTIVSIVYIALGVLFWIVGNEVSNPSEVDTVVQEVKTSEPVVEEKHIEDDSYKKAKSELSLAGISVGDNVDEVKELRGNPIKTRNADNLLIYEYKDVEVSFDRDEVIGVVSSTDSAKTKKGVSVKTDIKDVISLYGDGYSKFDYDGMSMYEYKINLNSKSDGILRFAVDKSTGKTNYISARLYVDDKISSKDLDLAKQTIESYHKAISDQNYDSAANYMSNELQKRMGVFNGSFAKDFSTTVDSRVDNIKVVSDNDGKIVFSYVLRAKDIGDNGKILTQKFIGKATLVKLDDKWLIDDMENKKE